MEYYATLIIASGAKRCTRALWLVEGGYGRCMKSSILSACSSANSYRVLHEPLRPVQSGEGDAHARQDALEVGMPRVAVAPLDLANPLRVEPGPFGNLPLRQAEGGAQGGRALPRMRASSISSSDLFGRLTTAAPRSPRPGRSPGGPPCRRTWRTARPARPGSRHRPSGRSGGAGSRRCSGGRRRRRAARCGWRTRRRPRGWQRRPGRRAGGRPGGRLRGRPGHPAVAGWFPGRSRTRSRAVRG